MYHVVLPYILIQNNMNNDKILTSKREGFARQIKRKVYIGCIYVYMIVNIVYTPCCSFSSKWVFTLGLLAEMRLDDFLFIFFFILFIYIAIVKLKDCNEMQLLIFSLFFFYFLITILCLIYTKNQLELRRLREEQKSDQINMSMYTKE